jgi:hypothetical protein
MSAIIRQPPAVVYQSRRNETDSLDSTTRVVVDIQLSAAQHKELDQTFIARCREAQQGAKDRESVQKRRELILQSVLKSSIWVDVVMYDYSIPTFFRRYDEEEDDDDALIDGDMKPVPPPSIELEASKAVKGLLHVSIESCTCTAVFGCVYQHSVCLRCRYPSWIRPSCTWRVALWTVPRACPLLTSTLRPAPPLPSPRCR